MATKWTTIAPGIRVRDHEERRHGVKPDRYFTVRFSDGGKQVEEGLGWASEGMTLTKAQAQLVKLKEAKRTGEGETSLRERREAVKVAAKAKLEADKLKAEEDTRRAAEDARRNVTLKAYFDGQYAPWARTTKSSAFKREENIWRCWIMPNLGGVPINQIGLEQWDHLVQTVTKAGLSERSREYITGTLRRIVKHARERRVVVEAPPTGRMIGATAPRDNRRLRVLTDAELQALLATLKARDLNAWRLTVFAAGTGCRLKEAYSLTWGNVDLPAGQVTLTVTKNKRHRPVPLGREVLAMLSEMQTGGPQEPVFLNHHGRAYSQVPGAFVRAVQELKLNDGRSPRDQFSFHSLRHSAATKLAKVLPLRGMMDVLGWQVPAMALRYTHTSEADRQVAAEALDRAFRPVPAEDKVVVLPARRKA